MKYTIPLFIILASIFFSCDPKNSLPDLDGEYAGSYTRGDSTTAITLSIKDFTFEGGSEAARFPAICHGTVGWDDYTIQFDDECVWTADFDWSLILSGSYTYAYSKDKLTFWRGTGDNYERYTIEKLKEE
ncbi:hypothetical protein ACE1ET_04270 [Saccharicrinis sp. FJH62]|uniref:hypothetical protein n=1 Tax=Saccharicrinis sp. FJH62 TaxID=3344657 RepID=UPI0035D45434